MELQYEQIFAQDQVPRMSLTESTTVQLLVPWKQKNLQFGALPCPSIYNNSLENTS